MKLKFLFIILLLICPCICFSADIKSGGGAGGGAGGGWHPFSWLMSLITSKFASKTTVSPEAQKLLDNVHTAQIQKNYVEVHKNLMNLLKIDPTNAEGNKILMDLILSNIYEKELKEYETEAWSAFAEIQPWATAKAPSSELSLSEFLGTGKNVAGAIKGLGNIDFSSR